MKPLLAVGIGAIAGLAISGALSYAWLRWGIADPLVGDLIEGR
nr:hypothetical protein [Mycobacterium eburneum]